MADLIIALLIVVRIEYVWYKFYKMFHFIKEVNETSTWQEFKNKLPFVLKALTPILNIKMLRLLYFTKCDMNAEFGRLFELCVNSGLYTIDAPEKYGCKIIYKKK